MRLATVTPARLAAWVRLEPRADAWASYGALALACLAATMTVLATA